MIRKDHVNNVNREILEKNFRVDGMLNTLLQDDVCEEEVENVFIFQKIFPNKETQFTFLFVFTDEEHVDTYGEDIR